MKRTCLILAAACLILGSVACSSKNAETAASETTALTQESEGQEKEESSAGEKDGGKETEKETEEETKETTQEETTAKIEKEAVTGRVVKLEKSILTLKGQDESEYQFDIKDADTESDLEIGEGDEVQVVYMNDEEDDAEVIKAESYLIITSMSMVGDMDPVVFGVIQKADAGTITIESGSGKTYRFSTAIAQIVDGGEGMLPGEYAEITYLGGLSDGKALRVVMEKASGDAEATYYSMLGSLAQASESSITITAKDGTSFTFSLGENVFASDYEVGEALEISYEGSLTNKNAVAIAVDYE